MNGFRVELHVTSPADSQGRLELTREQIMKMRTVNVPRREKNTFKTTSVDGKVPIVLVAGTYCCSIER